jgi:hypothetical protein
MLGDPRLPRAFWERVTPEPSTGCWIWKGAAFVHGSGQFRLNGKTHQCHRLAYRTLVPGGDVSNYMYLSCREMLCCNPQHVRLKPKKTLERERQRNVRRYHKDVEASRAKGRRLHPRKQVAARERILKQKYGITSADVERMRVEQGDRCAICSKVFDKTHCNKMCVDHCHATGVVRGLLCTLCNLGVGNFRDRRELLENAISYLDKDGV